MKYYLDENGITELCEDCARATGDHHVVEFRTAKLTGPFENDGCHGEPMLLCADCSIIITTTAQDEAAAKGA